VPENGEQSNQNHENALLVCFGGLSNTGYITALASMEVVRRVGLRKAAIFCLAGLPAGVKSVANRLEKAKRVITVDGCANNCARKLAESAGVPIDRSITLAVDLGVTKIPFHQHLADNPDDPMRYVSKEDIDKTVEAILAALG